MTGPASRSRRVPAFTEDVVATEKTATGEVRSDDAPGLVLRVGVNTASWRLEIKFRGKIVRHTLGDTEDVTVSRAKSAAESARERASQGSHPLSGSSTGRMTFADAVDLWQASREEQRTIERRVAQLHRHLAPLMKVDVQNLTDLDFVRTLRDLRLHHPPTCRNVLADAHAVLNHHVERRVIDMNPVKIIKPPKMQKRDAFLTLDEMFRVYHDVPDLPPPDRALLGFLIVTGLRIGETLQITASEFDRAGRRLTIASRKNKMNRAERVHVTDEAMRWLDLALDGRDTPDAVVFNPGNIFTAERRRRLAGWMNLRSRARAERRTEPGWVGLHDIRRTFLTEGQIVGINGTALDLCLGHEPRGELRRRYDSYDFWDEKVTAWEQWSAVVFCGSQSVPKAVDRDTLRKLVLSI